MLAPQVRSQSCSLLPTDKDFCGKSLPTDNQEPHGASVGAVQFHQPPVQQLGPPGQASFPAHILGPMASAAPACPDRHREFERNHGSENGVEKRNALVLLR